MQDDPSLTDEQLEQEIRLVGDLVLAASQCQRHLSDDEIDAILGLEPAGPAVGGPPGDGAPGPAAG